MTMKRLLLLVLLAAGPAHADIAPETLGRVHTLPATWPDHWIVAADAAFFHINDAKFFILDAASDDAAGRYKGMLDGAFVPLLYLPKKRPEIYILETYKTRGHRGERTDVLTIYDKETLSYQAEIELPAKRMVAIPTRYYFQATDDDSLGLVYNFTPAQSVSLVDLEKREFLGEVPTPGCASVYPMAGRAFASLCADGTMLSMKIAADGSVAASERSTAFFDADTDPLTEKPAIIDGVAYFVSFHGKVVPVDLNGDKPAIGDAWSLLSGDDDGWRPGGIVLADGDRGGRLYVLMHPEGYDGSHKDPGTEVWVFDATAGRRLQRIVLGLPAITIGITGGDEPLLVTTNVEMAIDVYDAGSGEHRRTIDGIGQETVFVYYGER